MPAVDHARGLALRASNGPDRVRSTLTITMCLPCRSQRAHADPGRNAGRLDDHLDVGECDQSLRIRRHMGASGLECFTSDARRSPARPIPGAQLAPPRATSRSRLHDVDPRVRLACARNMVPNFPAPMRPTVTGRPAPPFEQHGVRFTETSILSPRARRRSAWVSSTSAFPARKQFIAVHCYWHTRA